MDEVINDSIKISVINVFLSPLEINMSPLESTKTFINYKPYTLLQPLDTLKNALVIPIKKVADTTKVAMNDYVNFKAFFGDPNIAEHNDNYLYNLPYAKGKRARIIQTFNGKFSHNLPSSKYAIDFALAIGDTIYAARGGVVFLTKENSKEHCKTRKCADKANKIFVLHDDGTFAHYVHLDYNGVLVEVGDNVAAGQPIGINGLTGFTTTPHLHFVVFQPRGISVPIYFKGRANKILKKDRYYKRMR